jgi:P-type conjugative transfer protein TrbJ
VRMFTRKVLIASALSIGTAGSLAMGLFTASTPARAQISVFDPTNYSQNLLTAARRSPRSTIRSSRSRTKRDADQPSEEPQPIDFPQLQQLNQRLRQIDRLMGQAQGIDFRIDGLDQQFSRCFRRTSTTR